MGCKLRVGVIFGGRSGEHEISIISARSVMGALDRDKYEVVPIGITRTGVWLTAGDPMARLEALLAGEQPQTGTAAPQPSGGSALMEGLEQGFPQLDVVFPVLHGPYGEDGTIQGMFEMANLPYVGAGVHGSSLCMDKISCKRVLLACGIPAVDYVETTRTRWEAYPDSLIEQVEQQLGYPCFVKPANLGSSVGVSRAQDRQGLRAAMDLAAQYDRRLLVERGLDAREIEVSVLGNEEPEASIPGEIVPCREFYDYEAKYIDASC
jgi:D-alanine-D-alanine ligase